MSQICPRAISAPILIALGGNLASHWGDPEATLELALHALERNGVRILKHSAWYRTAPWPPSAQPPFLNAVIAVETPLRPAALMALLHRIERRFGRMRRRRNEARVLDFDLIDYRGAVSSGARGPILPHPRVHLRDFVLVPLFEVAPHWRHPVLGRLARPRGSRVRANRVERACPPRLRRRR